MSFTLHHGDCLDVLRGMADNSIDSIVTDPPYGLSFMGKKWDYDVPAVDVWAECLRVLKPGGHLLAFAGTRTQHRMAVRIEDAGFEIRDMIAWVYGSGFPKSLDVSKALDKVAGVEREAVGLAVRVDGRVPELEPGNCAHDGYGGGFKGVRKVTAPATEAAAQWQGWGTALKPALEPITVARKPLAGTVAANVLEWGTGALNIEGCRIGTESTRRPTGSNPMNPASGWNQNSMVNMLGGSDSGRWPANFIHDGGEPADQLGGAARFFYCAKASKKDRDEGMDGFELNYVARENGFSDKLSDTKKPRANNHPTVKPSDLMAYLCRLVTPPGGIVLDPFMGSGSTGKAAMREGFDFIGIEKDAGYFAIAQRRIEQAQQQLFAGVAA